MVDIPVELQNVEWKTSLSDLKAAVQCIAAFASTSGGTLVFGVDPSGEVTGVTIGRNTLENLANDIKRNTDPPQFPSITQESEGGKSVVLVQVSKSPEVPVLAYGRGYKRVGRTNQQLSSSEIRKVSLESTGTTWDMLVCPSAVMESIDGEAIRLYKSELRQKRGLDMPNAESVPVVLEKLHLLESGHLKNAAILLFGKDPDRFFPQAQLRCARFKGTDSVDFLDMKAFAGNLFYLLDQAALFVERHTSTSVEFAADRLRRKETDEYPPEAVREALVNAICHRDYTDTGNVQVRIFDDRMEIWSPGLLPAGLTVESLKGPHQSKPRNIRIADCFYRAGLVEQWGTGTRRMVTECLDWGLPEPEFKEISGCLVVHFGNAKRAVRLPDEGGLNERQTAALALLRQGGSISSPEYAAAYQVSRTTAFRELRAMTSRGLLSLIGRTRTARYIAEDRQTGSGVSHMDVKPNETK